MRFFASIGELEKGRFEAQLVKVNGRGPSLLHSKAERHFSIPFPEHWDVAGSAIIVGGEEMSGLRAWSRDEPLNPATLKQPLSFSSQAAALAWVSRERAGHLTTLFQAESDLIRRPFLR